MSLAKIVATTTRNSLPESQRSGWARQNSMANNIEYLLAYEIQRITRVYDFSREERSQVSL